MNGKGPLRTTEVVITAAGELKATHIIHAVGPRFQEEDLESKLRITIQNCLKQADDKGIKAVAFPAMGAGFYGVPLDVCARVTLGRSGLPGRKNRRREVVVCVMDKREYQPFQKQLAALGQSVKELRCAILNSFEHTAGGGPGIHGPGLYPSRVLADPLSGRQGTPGADRRGLSQTPRSIIYSWANVAMPWAMERLAPSVFFTCSSWCSTWGWRRPSC